MSTSNDPLWAKVAMAFDSAPNAREGAAAMLRVVADEVAPEEPPGDTTSIRATVDKLLRDERQGIRQRLLAEAEQAEVGR